MAWAAGTRFPSIHTLRSGTPPPYGARPGRKCYATSMADTIRDLAERHWQGEGDLVHEHHPVRPMLKRKAEEIAPSVLTMISVASINAIDTGDGLVMLDTGGVFDVDHVFDEVRGWRPAAPLRAAVYSHHHIDHVYGTKRFEAEATDRGWSPAHRLRPRGPARELPALRAHAGLEHRHQPAPVRVADRELELLGRLPLPRRHLQGPARRSATAT